MSFSSSKFCRHFLYLSHTFSTPPPKFQCQKITGNIYKPQSHTLNMILFVPRPKGQKDTWKCIRINFLGHDLEGIRTVSERLCIAAHRANGGGLEERATCRLWAAAVTRATCNKTQFLNVKYCTRVRNRLFINQKPGCIISFADGERGRRPKFQHATQWNQLGNFLC